jgi:serine/threonine protein kinase
MGAAPSHFDTSQRNSLQIKALSHIALSSVDDAFVPGRNNRAVPRRMSLHNHATRLEPIDIRECKSFERKTSPLSPLSTDRSFLTVSNVRLSPISPKSSTNSSTMLGDDNTGEDSTPRVNAFLSSTVNLPAIKISPNTSPTNMAKLRHSMNAKISTMSNASDYDEADELLAMYSPYSVFLIDGNKDRPTPQKKKRRETVAVTLTKMGVPFTDSKKEAPREEPPEPVYIPQPPKMEPPKANHRYRSSSLMSQIHDRRNIAEPPIPIISTNKANIGRHLRGKKTINQYEMMNVLGKGTYGKVWLCTNGDSGELCALKVINKSILKNLRKLVPPGFAQKNNDANVVRTEIAVLKKLNHPNVVKLLEVIDDPEQDKIYLVFEYIDGGELLTLHGGDGIVSGDPFTEIEARACFRQLIMALEYLHDNRVIHRDIKPSNCLMTKDGVLKVSDFGVSKYVENPDNVFTDSEGTPAFLPPESCGKKGFRGKPADIWACGITLFTMIFGELPFKGQGVGPARVVTLFRAVQYQELQFPDDSDISDDLKDLLLRILDKNPETRIDMDGIINHPWISIDDDGSEDLMSEMTDMSHFDDVDTYSNAGDFHTSGGGGTYALTRKESMLSCRSNMSRCSNLSLRSCVSRGSLRSFREVRSAHKGHTVSITRSDVERAIERPRKLPEI